MKKIALVAAAAVLSGSAFASGFGTEDTFYVKVEGGVDFPQTSKVEGVKLKGKKTGFAGVGAGYYLMENVRAELGLSYHFNPKLEAKSAGEKATLKIKAMTLMPKIYVDLFEVSDFGAVFVGGGVGISQLSAKAKDLDGDTEKGKKTTNAAFNVSAGAGFVVADGVKLEARYDFGYHGKIAKGAKQKFKTHQAVLGARFDV